MMQVETVPEGFLLMWIAEKSKGEGGFPCRNGGCIWKIKNIF